MSERTVGHKVLAAAFKGKLSKLQKLLEEEDPTLLDCPSVDYADEAGTTALHAACQEGHAECVALLLRAGAMADTPGAGGVTPLIVACESAQLACVKLLLDAKADVAAKDDDNSATALHGACNAGATECAQALLSARAPVDAVDAAGASPLIVAAYAGHARCVKVLLTAGADDTLEYEGKTAVELAEEAGHAECVAVLEGRDEPKSAAVDADDDVSKKPAPPAKSMLDELADGLKASGVGGAELIEEKKKEMAELEKLTEAREKAAAELAAEKALNKPTSAAAAKEKANGFFTSGKVAEAAEMYELSLTLLEAELTSADGKEADVEAVATGAAAEPPARALLHCNLAACRLRQRMWIEAVEECDAACDLLPHYTKALYRRAQAKRHLRRFGEALADAQSAHTALCRVGGGVPIGEAGRKTAAEISKFVAAVKTEAETEQKEAERKEREEFGITLGMAEGSEDDKSVYYHCERRAAPTRRCAACAASRGEPLALVAGPRRSRCAWSAVAAAAESATSLVAAALCVQTPHRATRRRTSCGG
jgi:hypothetical protein